MDVGTQSMPPVDTQISSASKRKRTTTKTKIQMNRPYHIKDEGSYAGIIDATGNTAAIVRDLFLADKILTYLNTCQPKGITVEKKECKDSPVAKNSEQ